MEISNERKKQVINYFNELAKTRIVYRKKKKYYWNHITQYCNFFINKDDTVLEIGCGTGELIAAVKGKRKVGVDFSQAMIINAKKQFPDISFLVMDAENMETIEKFDVIILSNLIGHLTDVQQVFEEIKKNCHDRTKIIITYYNHLWEPLIKIAEGIGLKKKMMSQNWLSKYDIANLLYIAGFETYKQNASMLFPYHIPLLSAFINNFVSRLPLINYLALNQYTFARLIPHISYEDAINKYSTSVIIPARNESGNIENAIHRIPRFGKHIEIIFVEGNSTDDTWETIKKIQEKYKDTHDIKITQQDGKGKGDAVRKGYNLASGDILMILDADLTVPPEQLPKFYYALAMNKGDFINGTRLIYPMEKNAMRPLNTLGNKFFSIVFSWLMEQPIKDTLCGTKVLFRNDYYKLAANRSYFGDFDPFGDFDLLFGAFKLNHKIIDMPIRYQERTYGDTNISRFKHGLLLLKMWWFALFKIKFK